VYRQILINAKLKAVNGGQKTELTGEKPIKVAKVRIGL
jgi:hypothetical protein